MYVFGVVFSGFFSLLCLSQEMASFGLAGAVLGAVQTNRNALVTQSDPTGWMTAVILWLMLFFSHHVGQGNVMSPSPESLSGVHNEPAAFADCGF